MRILIPNFPAPDSFVDNVSYTLQRMGHEVICAPKIMNRSRNAVATVLRELRERALPNALTEAEHFALTAARAHAPDMVLCLTLVLRQQVLDDLRAMGVRHLVAWWGDTPANMRGLGLLSDGWDVIFLKDPAAVQKFRAVGLEAQLLHEAMNPAWHKRLFDRVGEEIVVAGSSYGYRQILVERLLAAGEPIALYGPPPPRWSRPAILRAHKARYIVKEEKSRTFGAGLACLNSTALSEGNALNCRAFEIAGCCGLQLIEDKSAVSMCFEPGREVLTYQSVDEIREHLARARKEPAWAMSIREAGARRALAEHTYEHRLGTMLRHLGERAQPAH